VVLSIFLCRAAIGHHCLVPELSLPLRGELHTQEADMQLLLGLELTSFGSVGQRLGDSGK
jgi:hypothetical protein